GRAVLTLQLADQALIGVAHPATRHAVPEAETGGDAAQADLPEVDLGLALEVQAVFKVADGGGRGHRGCSTSTSEKLSVAPKPTSVPAGTSKGASVAKRQMMLPKTGWG